MSYESFCLVQIEELLVGAEDRLDRSNAQNQRLQQECQDISASTCTQLTNRESK